MPVIEFMFKLLEIYIKLIFKIFIFIIIELVPIILKALYRLFAFTFKKAKYNENSTMPKKKTQPLYEPPAQNPIKTPKQKTSTTKSHAQKSAVRPIIKSMKSEKEIVLEEEKSEFIDYGDHPPNFQIPKPDGKDYIIDTNQRVFKEKWNPTETEDGVNND